MNYMNDATRNKVITIAKQSGFLVQTKPGGLDLYKKNIVFKHRGVGQTVYVRKERGVDSLGNAKKFILAIHPDYYRQEFSNPSRGFVRLRNTRNGGYNFASSNYSVFPAIPNSQQYRGCHIEAVNHVALGELFEVLSGKSLVSAQIPTDFLLSKNADHRSVSLASDTMPRFDEPLDSAGSDTTNVIGDLSGLVIRREPLLKILKGGKTWEMRSKKIHKRGQIALIEKGTGLVVGVANLVDCKGPLNEAEMLANQDKHQITQDRINSGEIANWRTAGYSVIYALSHIRFPINIRAVRSLG